MVVPLKRFVKPVQNRLRCGRRRERQPNYDEIDKQALRLMRKLRVDWSAEEDNFLLICKVAMMALCPPRKVTVSGHQIRDCIHWSLKSFDKTSRACSRRIVYMMRNESIASSVHLCVQDIKDNQAINDRFNFAVYHSLRKRFSNEDDFLMALKVLYVDFVFTLQKEFKTVSTKSFESRKTILPDTVVALHQQYTVKPEQYSHLSLKYAEPCDREAIDVNTLISLIHSSVCCAHDKTSWNIQLYDIYKKYADTTLCQAMAKVRFDQLISANKCATQSKISVRNLPLSSSPYHLSIRYQYMMGQSLFSYDVFGDALTAIRSMAVGQQRMLDFDRISGGRCLLLAELLHKRDIIRCSVTLPPVMLVIDPKKCKKDTSFRRMQNRFRSIIGYIQNDNEGIMKVPPPPPPPPNAKVHDEGHHNEDDDEAIKSKRRKCASRRVTISESAHRTKEYFVGPIEKLMKIDDSLYHFYCLLANLGQTIDLTALSIGKEDHLCQFDCVLARSNPVEAAIEIIREHGVRLANINADEQLDLSFSTMRAADSNITVDLDENTILVAFNILVNRRYAVGDDDEEVYPREEITDHGMLKLSLDILRGEEAADAAKNGEMVIDVSVTESDWFTQQQEMHPAEQPEQTDINVDVENDDDNDTSGGGGGGADDDGTEQMEDLTSDKIHKMHDYFFLNSCNVSVGLADDVEPDTQQIGTVPVPKAIVTWDTHKKDALLSRIPQDAVWHQPPINVSTEDFQKKLRDIYTPSESKKAMHVMEFVESKMELGATNVDLTVRNTLK